MKDKIDSLLDSSKISQIIFDRGFHLYNTSGVELVNYNSITKTASLWVRGSAGRYLNNVHWKNKNIVTECTCPYNHSSHCKHSVASLLFLKNHSEKDLLQITLNNKFPATVVSKPNIKRRTSVEPYILNDLTIWEKVKKEYVTEELYTFVKPALTFKDISALNVEVLLPISKNTLYDETDHYSINDKSFHIKFFIENQKVVTTCNCNQTVDRLCKHQAYVVKSIIETSDIFKAFDKNFISKVQLAHFKKIDLKPTEKNKALFEFSYISLVFSKCSHVFFC